MAHIRYLDKNKYKYKGRNNVYHYLTDDEMEDLEKFFDDEDTKETEVIVKDIDWKGAYEANKKRNTCIVCGKDTIIKQLFSSSIRYCSCVEELAKKR